MRSILPSKREIQCKLGMYFSFDFGCHFFLLPYSLITVTLYVGKVKFSLLLFFFGLLSQPCKIFTQVFTVLKHCITGIFLIHPGSVQTASNLWITIFIVFMQVGVSVAVMQLVLSAAHNCFYCKMQITVSVIAMMQVTLSNNNFIFLSPTDTHL